MLRNTRSQSRKAKREAIALICLLFAVEAVPADEPAPERKIDLPVPIGHEVKGLRVPVRNADGKLEMQLDVESATRMDIRNVKMNTVSIQTFNEQTSKPDIKIDLKSSMMNMDTNVITSDEPIVVSRTDFRLTGDAMEFNSKTRHGTVMHNVKMVVYNREAIQGASAAQTPKPGE
ncbi:MAG: LPS export ABC transporter periplasmic protein LptC [Verrucomicrobia bacterium]|nr:LPS export ABC transporter periplasmic protein LptC [Verrucomicrobiota bacterium]